MPKYFLFFIYCILTQWAWSQNNFGNVENRYINYTNTILQEKLFVHTDKDTYLAGEILWFSTYNLDAWNHKPLHLSKIAYLEILDVGNNPVLQTKIALKGGIGDGSFNLPTTIPTGIYHLRAYTNWMKNFSPEHYFHKKITIYNTLREDKAAFTTPSDQFNIQFFPEGGHLVNGISNRIAFKGINSSGRGATFKGYVIDNKNDTIVRFEPSKFGIGTFNFTPYKNINYRILIRPEGGKPLFTKLPEIASTGYILQLLKKGPGIHKLVIKTNVPGSQAIRLFVHTGNQAKINKKLPLINGIAEIDISEAELDEGISHFTILDTADNPLCERLFFKRPSKLLQINAKVEKHQYAKREKVRVELENTNGSKPLTTNFSVSVSLLDSLDHESGSDIASFAWLTSDLKGNVENPQYYLKTVDDVAVDNLMLTHGWRRFKWDEIKQLSVKNFDHQPELDGHIITGRLLDSIQGTPTPNRTAYLSIPGRHLQIYAATSDSIGNLKFYAKDLLGSNEVILQTDPRKDSLLKVELSTPFSSKFAELTTPEFPYSEALSHDLRNRSVATQVGNIYHGRQLKKEYLHKVDSVPFFFKSNRVYHLDDYVRFATMEEILREYVAEIFVELRKKTFHLRVLDTKKNQLHTEPPLILVDGVPIFNTDDLMKFDPHKIRKIEIVGDEYLYGSARFHGITKFDTYKGDLSGMPLNPHATVMDYEGVQARREFYSPMYDGDSNSARMPDFRTTLFWSANQITDKDGKSSVSFFSSDLPGKYKVLIQGVGQDGSLGSKELVFEVK